MVMEGGVRYRKNLPTRNSPQHRLNRENGPEPDVQPAPDKETSDNDKRRKISPEFSHKVMGMYTNVFSVLVGACLLLIVGGIHFAYMHTLHENDLWFSNIKEVEREISFRTESGLYYSYYKQMIKAPTISQGIHELMNDNITEHGHTINVLARMNVYQEVFLAALYKTIPLLQKSIEPVYLYLDSIFLLHGMLVGALYAITWMISGSWLAGLLSAVFYIFNKDDTTRVSFVIPLRESFALPFLWIQLAFLTLYFKPNIQRKTQVLSVLGIGLFTFLFSLTWQFNQFILLLQAMALFAVQILEFVPPHKIRNVYLVQILSLLLVSLLQFGNTMIISGPCLSFILSALLIMFIQKYERPIGVIQNFLAVFFHIVLVFFIMAAINITAKFITQQEADEHIGKFVLTKFGILGEMSQMDFDVRLYLCNGAFNFISYDVFERMTRKLVFPIYAYGHAVMISILVIAFIQKSSYKKSSTQHSDGDKKRGKACEEEEEEEEEEEHMFSGRPDLAFHALQSLFFAVLAISTLRMKYLWTPYMCILAAVSVSDKIVTTWLLQRCNIQSPKAVATVRHFLTLAVFLGFLHLVLPPAQKELEDLREFYDPDTVELMKWIKTSTPIGAAFTGSMQLLAGVKLCTGRPVSNHPHYEDKALRLRTRELYQMYGRRSAEDVHSIMIKYDVSYIILEDSICLAPSRANCRLPDLIDINNGIMPDAGSSVPDLIKSKVPRFCDKVRHSEKNYAKYFKPVFSNKTFRVYQIHRPGQENKGKRR